MKKGKAGNTEMPYDFTSIISQEGMDSLAVEGLGWGFAPSAPREGFDFIPLWIADMNFPTAPSIGEALARRAQHPLFGYFSAPPTTLRDGSGSGRK